MKFTPNKYLLICIGLVAFTSNASKNPPPPPAGPPPPPGFPVDQFLFVAVIFAVLFSFFYLKRQSNKFKAN